MPPPSPVWTHNYRDGKSPVVFFDASFKMSAKIEGRVYESKSVVLKVKQPEIKKK